MPSTWTAARRLVVVLSPSWPKSFLPQHHTVPLARMAQLWKRAGAIVARAPPQNKVPPQPSAMVPEVWPCSWQVVGVHCGLQTLDVPPPPQGRSATAAGVKRSMVVWSPSWPYWL